MKPIVHPIAVVTWLVRYILCSIIANKCRIIYLIIKFLGECFAYNIDIVVLVEGICYSK